MTEKTGSPDPTAHARIRAAALAIYRGQAPRWDVIGSLIKVEQENPALRLLEGLHETSPWYSAARAASAALKVEAEVALPGLALLVAKHEELRARTSSRS